MQYSPLQGYNTQIKIAGQDVTLKRYKQKQVRGYGRNERGKIVELGNRHEANVFGVDMKFLVNNDASDSSINKKEYTDEEKRKRFIKSVYRAKETIYDIIACNVGQWGKHTSKFVTLTFRDNVTDIKEANAEFTSFIKDLNYYLYQSKRGILKYICIPELQERGAWHYHILFFNLPLIPVNGNKVLDLKEKGVLEANYPEWKNLLGLWGNGFVGVNSITDNARVAAYVTKYLTKGIEFDENGKPQYKTEGEDKGLKRLCDYELYTSLGLENMKRYQCSRGLLRPAVYHAVTSKEQTQEIYRKMESDRKLIQLDKTKKKINMYQYENEYRGEIVVINFRIAKKHLKQFVQSVDKLSNENRQKYSKRLYAPKVHRMVFFDPDKAEAREVLMHRANISLVNMFGLKWVPISDEEFSSLFPESNAV